MSYSFLILFVVFIILELISVNLVTIWFALGALISFILSFFINSELVLILTFIIVSVLSLIFTRPFVKKYLKVKPTKLNLDKVVGMEGIVTKEVDKFKMGEAKVDGKYWSIVSNKRIEKGRTIIVNSIDGVKLNVSVKEDLWHYILF